MVASQCKIGGWGKKVFFFSCFKPDFMTKRRVVMQETVCTQFVCSIISPTASIIRMLSLAF